MQTISSKANKENVSFENGDVKTNNDFTLPYPMKIVSYTYYYYCVEQKKKNRWNGERPLC